MKGIVKYRRGGPDDTLLREIMVQKGITEVPFYRKDRSNAQDFNVHACMQAWMAYVPERDGPVNSEQPEGNDPDRIASLIKAKGKDEMMKRINAKDPDFVQGQLYIDLRDVKTGIVLAHPYNPSIVGKDLTDVPDANGKKYRREIIELAAAKGKGWVDYQYKNPSTGKIGPKTTYILLVDGVVLEAGIYKK